MTAVSPLTSQEASIQAVDNRSSGAQTMISLFQQNLIGSRAARINWEVRRSQASAVIVGVT
jgi:hypothetical protein